MNEEHQVGLFNNLLSLHLKVRETEIQKDRRRSDICPKDNSRQGQARPSHDLELHPDLPHGGGPNMLEPLYALAESWIGSGAGAGTLALRDGLPTPQAAP